jgi:hypothetical protein
VPPLLGHGLKACGLLGTLPALSPSHVGVFWSKKNHHKRFIPFGLRLIFLSVKAKNKEKKQQLALGTRLIG